VARRGSHFHRFGDLGELQSDYQRLRGDRDVLSSDGERRTGVHFQSIAAGRCQQREAAGIIGGRRADLFYRHGCVRNGRARGIDDASGDRNRGREKDSQHSAILWCGF
jgi:hypothetical protein